MAHFLIIDSGNNLDPEAAMSGASGADSVALVVDSVGVRRQRSDGVPEAVAWAALRKVEIVTTDDGPFSEDFFWLLHGVDGEGVCIGQELASTVDLLGRLQQLPGFNNEAVIRASCCVEPARFVCWEPGVGR